MDLNKLMNALAKNDIRDFTIKTENARDQYVKIPQDIAELAMNSVNLKINTGFDEQKDVQVGAAYVLGHSIRTQMVGKEKADIRWREVLFNSANPIGVKILQALEAEPTPEQAWEAIKKHASSLVILQNVEFAFTGAVRPAVFGQIKKEAKNHIEQSEQKLVKEGRKSEVTRLRDSEIDRRAGEQAEKQTLPLIVAIAEGLYHCRREVLSKKEWMIVTEARKAERQAVDDAKRNLTTKALGKLSFLGLNRDNRDEAPEATPENTEATNVALGKLSGGLADKPARKGSARAARPSVDSAV